MSLAVLWRVSVCQLLLLLFVTSQSCRAFCPSNGNVHAIYFTVNGDKGDSDVYSLDTNGHFVGGIINWSSVPSHVRLAKLRAMRFGPGGLLYVSSVEGALSRIFALSGKLNSDCTRDYVSSYVHVGPHNPSMQHPYDFVFAKDGTLYVANQNSVTITRYCGQHSDVCKPGEPMDPAPPNRAPGEFLCGQNPRTPNASFASIRGIALSPDEKYLLLADVDGSSVLVFDRESGDLAWRYDLEVKYPVQISFVRDVTDDESAPFAESRDHYFLVTSKMRGTVYRLPLRAPNTLTQPHAEEYIANPRFEATSGIAYNAAHRTMYVADRIEKRVFRYRDDGLLIGRFSDRLLDHPEHLLYVALADPRKFPLCYEMGRDGLKFSVLCTGVEIWGLIFLFAPLVYVVLRVRAWAGRRVLGRRSPLVEVRSPV